jgi:hypothetical protein
MEDGLEGDALRQRVLRVVKDLDPVYLQLMLRVSRLHRDIIPSLSNVVSAMGRPPPITSTSPRSHHTTVQLGALPVSLQETEPTPVIVWLHAGIRSGEVWKPCKGKEPLTESETAGWGQDVGGEFWRNVKGGNGKI